MTIAQEFTAYLPRARDTLDTMRVIIRQLPERVPSAMLERHINRAAWRLQNYSVASESGFNPMDGSAIAQAEGYRRSLSNAIDELDNLLGRDLAGTWPGLGRDLAGTWPGLGRAAHGSVHRAGAELPRPAQPLPAG